MTKLGITREPGENEADFQRRYCREKMRLYRAAKPKLPRKPHGKHVRPAKNWTGSTETWEAMQRRPDESPEEHRKRYNRERTARHRAAHRDRLKQERLAHYAANKVAINAQVQKRREAKPELYKAHSRRNFEKNRASKLAKLKEWGERNAERLAEVSRRHREANPGLYASYSAKWRKCCRVATPPWADFKAIQAFYDEAARLSRETGVPHAVDHIVPVQGKDVCGLHVQTNLQVIPASANSRKRNKFDAELVYALMMADIAAL